MMRGSKAGLERFFPAWLIVANWLCHDAVMTGDPSLLKDDGRAKHSRLRLFRMLASLHDPS
jgi:hypothetical protein